MIAFLRRAPFEAYIWLAGLAYLAWCPEVGRPDLCLAHRMGVPFCPGCGLGRAIGCLFRGDIMGSISLHPLAIPAVLILAHRIGYLLYTALRSDRRSQQKEATLADNI
jgi:hypothetical protein